MNQIKYQQINNTIMKFDKKRNSKIKKVKLSTNQSSLKQRTINLNVAEQAQEVQIIEQNQQNEPQRIVQNEQQNLIRQSQQSDQNQNQIEQEQSHEHQEHEEMELLGENQRNLQEYQQQISNRGVIYLSRIPPYMTPNFIRKLLSNYNIQRIYLLPESEWTRKNRIKKGGSKRICFRQGWIQFADKKVAKMVALTLNGQKMVHKKGTFYSQDVWNLKYLAKFKWHHLTQKLAHEQRMKKEHLRLQMEQERKLHEYYSNQAHKSLTIKGIIKNKLSKGRELKNSSNRQFGQTKPLQQERD